MPGDSNESVVFKVEVDDSSVEKGMGNAKKKVTKAANETAEAQKKAQNSVSENAEANNDKIVDSSESADKKVKQSADDAAEARKKAQDDAARNAEETDKKIVDSAEKTHKSITDTASREGDKLVKKHEEDTEKLKKHQSDYEEKAKKTAENVKKFYAAAGAAIIAETTAAIVAAANYQSSYAKVFTLTSDGTDEAAYANSIKQASKNTGVNVTDMSESVYSAISASVDQDKAVAFTEDAVKLAKGGFTETATAVDVLTTAINAYGLAADDASHISDVLINTQNKGKTTVDELARSMGQTIPVANSAHTAIEELSTDYAVLTKNGVATAEAGTQIKAMYSELNASGTQVSKTLREITGKSFAELKDEGQTTADVLNTLSDYARSSGQSLQDLFGSVEAGNAAFTLIKDGGADFADILNSMYTSSGAAEKAYEKMTNTIEAKSEKLLNKITIMFAEAGEEMLPLVDELIDYVDENADEIEDIIKGIGELMKNVIIVAGDTLKVLWEHKEAVAAVAAAFVAYKTAIAISSVIDKFKASTEGATMAQKLLNAAMNANPAGLIAGTIAALTVGMISLSNAIMDTGGRMDDMNAKADELIKSAKEYRDKSEKLSDISKKYEEIQNSEAGAATKADELQSLQQELINQYGDQASGIDLVNGKYEEQAGLLEKLIDKNHELAKATADEALAEAEAAEKQASSVDAGSMLFNVDNTEIAQWAARNLSSFDAGWSMLGSTAGKTGISLSGSYEERAADWEKFYNYLTADRGLTKDNDLVKQVREQWEKMLDNADSLKSLKDAVENLDKAQEDMKDTTNSVSDAENKATESTSYLTEKTNEAAEAEKSLKEITDDLNDSTKDIIDQYGSLYDSLKNLENGGALNYDQMMKLIEIYPELADKISLTAGGYTLETEALNDLGMALDDNVAATVEAEKAKTQAVIEETKKRIEAAKEEYRVNAERYMRDHNYEKAAELQKSIAEGESSLSYLEGLLQTYDTVPGYLKSSKGKNASSSSSGGSSSGAKSGSQKEENENEKKYDTEYATLKYQHDMGEIDDTAFYKGIAELRDKYLEKDSDKWRSANVSIHNWEESQKKSAEKSSKTASSGTKTGTVISIDSYIPTVWDTEEEKNAKLKKAAGLDLAGGDMYKSNIRSIQDSASTVGSTVASTAPVASSSSVTTLSDVVDAIKDIQTADEHKKISFEVEFRARDLSLGKVVVADINDMTRINGKTPLIIK